MGWELGKIFSVSSKAKRTNTLRCSNPTLMYTTTYISAYVDQNICKTFQSCIVVGQIYIPNVHQHINIQMNKLTVIYSGIGKVCNNKNNKLQTHKSVWINLKDTILSRRHT